MRLHEYQAKGILAAFGVPAPRGRVAASAAEAGAIAAELCGPVLVKAQVHADLEDKARGIREAQSPEQAEKAAGEILTLAGHQARPVKTVLVEEAIEHQRGFGVRVILDRVNFMPAIMVSTVGGMEIEKAAKTAGGKIITILVNPTAGLRDFQVRKLTDALGLDKEAARAGAAVIRSLYNAYMENDCLLAEINPLVLTADNRLLAGDARMIIDDTALFRHPELKAMRDLNEEDPLEVEAGKYGLNYVRLEGNIGCIFNGAGLAMATMDLILAAGLKPANFLDVGGAAKQESVENAFRILLSDGNVKGVIINIFGGILHCDVLARGIVEVSKKLDVKIPVLVRLEGTKAQEGRKILADSGLHFTVAQDLKDAAVKVAGMLE